MSSSDGFLFYFFDKPGEFSFQIPQGINEIFIKMWGSSGDHTVYSGAGGYSEGKIMVNSSDEFGIEVGSPCISLLNCWRSYNLAGSRSAIWKNHRLNEIIVAGGGGAAGSNFGGAGGGLIGQSSMISSTSNPDYCNSIAYPAGGGTQTKGGTGGTATEWSGHYTTGVSGGRNFGSRGHGKLNYHEGGAGGGGFFGGGSGAASCYCSSGGGGGSGYLSPIVINGVTIAGNYSTPANPHDIQRGNAGSPGNNGLVIIKMKYMHSYRYIKNRKSILLFALCMSIV